jgi:hypothetical protein
MSLSVSGQINWWLSPISGAITHQIDPWIMWHARLMVLAWAILLPLGAIAARYFKVTPKQDWPRQLDNRAWWHAHQALQYSGVLLMLVGLALTWSSGSSQSLAAVWHGYLGWAVVAIGVLQVLSAWLRGSKGGPTEPQLRGDHYDMTAHRLWFERLHKTAGWLAIVAAVATVCLGLVAADAPRWMALVLAVWWLALIALAVRLERTGHGINTYQAIWGPDSSHPGNPTFGHPSKPMGTSARRLARNQERK